MHSSLSSLLHSRGCLEQLPPISCPWWQRGVGGGLGLGETAGLLQGAAVGFHCLLLKFPGRIAYFVRLSKLRSKARWGHPPIGHFSLNFGLTLYGWAVPFHQSSPFHCLKKKKTRLRLWEVTSLISQKSLLRQVKKQKEENEVLFWNEVLFSEFSNGGVYLLPCPFPPPPIF